MFGLVTWCQYSISCNINIFNVTREECLKFVGSLSHCVAWREIVEEVVKLDKQSISPRYNISLPYKQVLTIDSYSMYEYDNEASPTLYHGMTCGFTTCRSSRRDKKKLESRSSQQQQQPAKGSVQIDKKQQIPLPPSPPASNTADKVLVDS